MIFCIFLIISLAPMQKNNCQGHLRHFKFNEVSINTANAFEKSLNHATT